MKRTVFTWVFLFLCLASGPASAVICSLDDVPAATLLLPYFEVGANANTLFSLNNASSEAVLAHVVIWSDLSVPVLDFNVFLTGYDVQSFSLADLLGRGLLPRTASAGQDPADLISPKGKASRDIDFASCTGQLPLPELPPAFLDHLHAALTGRFSSILGGCAGLDYQDDVLRGYVTVDTVNNCTLRFPGDLGYFAAGGSGDATNQNVLWGEYFYFRDAHLASGQPLVHIEADAANPETSVPGNYTFYGRYVGWTAADNREPLATQFAAHFFLTDVFDTSLIVWRDSKVRQGAFACGALPASYPLGQEDVAIYDEEENPVTPDTFEVSPVTTLSIIPFPAETQRTRIVVGDSSTLTPQAPLPLPPFTLGVPYNFGWVALDLNTTVAAAGAVPPEDPAAAQAWVGVIVRQAAGGAIYSVGYDAVKLDSACRAKHP